MTRSFVRALYVAAPLVALVLLTGCSDSADGVVNGEVVLDGKEPLKKGHIKFVPTDPKKTAVESEITDGKFTARVPVGEAKVEITAAKVVGKTRMAPESPEVDQIEELLPPRFNVQSEIKMTVQKGTQEKRFDVQSK
jgi:hypothetical protein